MLAGRKMIRRGDAEHLNGGHAANVRYLWRQTYSVLALAVCEYDFGRLDPVKSQITVLRRPVTSKLWGQGAHCTSPKFRTCTPCTPKSKMRLMSKF